MRKNKEKRKKKGIVDDFVEGEDAPGAEQPAEPAVDLSEKAPAEAADDEWDASDKKGGKKGNAKAKQPEPAAAKEEPAAAAGGDDAGEDGGRVLTKAEKEKLKKEREKQKKKELVRNGPQLDMEDFANLWKLGC